MTAGWLTSSEPRVADCRTAAGAAALESSKVFSKRFMKEAGISPARYVVRADPAAALDAVAGDQFGFPVVIKADGLAAGKGVTVAANRGEAEAAVRAAMVDVFGEAGDTPVIEERLTDRRCRSSHRRMAGAPSPRQRAGSQAHLRRRSRTQHRRHGSVCSGP